MSTVLNVAVPLRMPVACTPLSPAGSTSGPTSVPARAPWNSTTTPSPSVFTLAATPPEPTLLSARNALCTLPASVVMSMTKVVGSAGTVIGSLV
ncbi:MAG: hypothetical protein E6J51_13405 [Chloroflexi bacterium]|nr:MAG: hypothetical protein E6J51_13405 [Chloroflexota bacterium]